MSKTKNKNNLNIKQKNCTDNSDTLLEFTTNDTISENNNKTEKKIKEKKIKKSESKQKIIYDVGLIENDDNYINTNTNTDTVLEDDIIQIKKKINNIKIIDPLQNFLDTMSWMEQFTEQPKKPKLTYNTLPWVEKFRPETMNNIISHKHTVYCFKEYIKKKQLPHLLLYGPPGTGKTSLIISCAKELYGDNFSLMVLEINASEERGIEVVRNKIKDFIITKGVFLNKKSTLFKLVILDEADAMTLDAQAMLRSVIEKYTENVRFCLICNYIKKINPAIQSRCTTFKFSPLSQPDIAIKIKEITNHMNIKITQDGIETITKISKGDMRKVINILQSTSMIYKIVNNVNVSKCVGYPSNENISFIMNELLTQNIKTAYTNIQQKIYENGYALSDILIELVDILINNFVSNNNKLSQKKFCNILINLRNIEMNLTLCPDENIQLAAIISIFKL